MPDVCVRCAAPPTSLMGYDYDQREVWIDDLANDESRGVTYRLCEGHADRMTPPVGWVLTDLRRPTLELFTAVDVA